MRPSPILVTGAPRSGTTWLARQLADSAGTALPGREPMNARSDSKHWYNPTGRQYALGGTLDGWTRLTEPTAKQRRSLRLAYSGLHPLLLSRYGQNQWRSLAPRTRVVVKDPFALLSLPAICRTTGATPVVVVRHPGAVLASYRRMGWSPDVAELAPIVQAFVQDNPDGRHLVEPARENMDGLTAMGWFWNSLYGMALADSSLAPQTIFVSHAHIAAAGEAALTTLRSALGLQPTTRSTARSESRAHPPASTPDESALHNFDRDPAVVADAWEHQLSPGEREQLEAQTSQVRAELGLATTHGFGPRGHHE